MRSTFQFQGSARFHLCEKKTIYSVDTHKCSCNTKQNIEPHPTTPSFLSSFLTFSLMGLFIFAICSKITDLPWKLFEYHNIICPVCIYYVHVHEIMHAYQICRYLYQKFPNQCISVHHVIVCPFGVFQT